MIYERTFSMNRLQVQCRPNWRTEHDTCVYAFTLCIRDYVHFYVIVVANHSIHNTYVWMCTPVPLWMQNIHFVYYCGSPLTFPLASTMHDKRVGCELVHSMPVWKQVHTQHWCWRFINIWLIFALKSNFVIRKSILVGFFGPKKPTKFDFSMTNNKFDSSAKTNQMLAKRQQQYCHSTTVYSSDSKRFK